MMINKFYYLFTILYPCASAIGPNTSSNLYPTHNVFQFDKIGKWLENIAVRPNGDLLTTLLYPTASLYTLKRPHSTTREFSLIHTFKNASGLLGITETSVDNFAILSTQLTDTLGPVPGSSAIWGVSFRHGNFSTRKIASIPDVLVPNGITSLPGSSVVLVADSIGGAVTRCDTLSGVCELVLNTTETAPVPGSSQRSGINGIHYQDGYVYWSNSGLVSLFRTPFDKQGYPVANAGIETVGKVNTSFVDDFTKDNTGRFWIATGSNNTIVTLRSDGSTEVAAGSLTELTVAGCTAAAFGRTVQDNRTLYVVTNGALLAPVNGTTEPAKIVAIDTSRHV
ncbi:hypothetical protein NUW58_g7545 [Xylaria curta]|uniref:Uncharacterized protein n=1 Tax=Xylaria curta TaxID=42375 RepID=A0ACC1NG55_9PEZI|nr:hypothetical protein NUW58_g7545 [Xylaria curta]